MKHFSREPAPLPLHFVPVPGFKSKSKAAGAARFQVKREKLKKQGGRCLYCTEPLSLKRATTEHRKPISRGGVDAPNNIDVACFSCNTTKGWRTKREFERAIFNPNMKRDPWPLYLACVEIRLKRRTEQACRRLARIVVSENADAHLPPQTLNARSSFVVARARA